MFEAVRVCLSRQHDARYASCMPPATLSECQGLLWAVQGTSGELLEDQWPVLQVPDKVPGLGEMSASMRVMPSKGVYFDYLARVAL